MSIWNNERDLEHIKLQMLEPDLLVVVSDKQEDGWVRGAQLPVEGFETGAVFACAVG